MTEELRVLGLYCPESYWADDCGIESIETVLSYAFSDDSSIESIENVLR